MDDPMPSNGVDWIMQSLCSAHLEEAHQWGSSMGVEDDIFVTNEEWTDFVEGANFTGIPAHVVDLANRSMHATGVFTLGGFEKIVEVNCGHADYVCFSPSGYNGNFGVSTPLKSGTRPDGTAYVWPQDIVPARLYIGKKFVDANGDPSDHFLARNGLMYGQLYGFAASDPSIADRDAYHQSASVGDVVEGAFHAIDWRWDGTVKPFTEDGSWCFQHLTEDGTEFWNAAGRDARGAKTEHNAPDPHGHSRFIQSSTAGYFGMYGFPGIADILAATNGADPFPTRIPANYTVFQGETDITAQVELGGKGVYAHGGDATQNYDSAQAAGSGKVTFEDIDGFYWFAADGSDLGYVLIQEDSGNDYGERMFIAELKTDQPLTYYFVAMSGGSENSRLGSNGMVGIPAGTWAAPGSHEFSGAIDLSGMLAKDSSGNFILAAGDGYAKRAAEAAININDKLIAIGLQAHNLEAGVIRTFRGDRGGQIYAYNPSLP